MPVRLPSLHHSVRFSRGTGSRAARLYPRLNGEVYHTDVRRKVLRTPPFLTRAAPTALVPLAAAASALICGQVFSAQRMSAPLVATIAVSYHARPRPLTLVCAEALSHHAPASIQRAGLRAAGPLRVFKFLAGFPPFSGSTPDETWTNLKNWSTVLCRPEYDKPEGLVFNLTDVAWDAVICLIAYAEVKEKQKNVDVVKEKEEPFGRMGRLHVWEEWTWASDGAGRWERIRRRGAGDDILGFLTFFCNCRRFALLPIGTARNHPLYTYL
ncbi:hypothetical protein K438DRAFT_1983016 [Mycena galopus ATCC 62051]|nr:hypothetical protein K438DRAFT_2001826 [Mycena galopus ATCC 62051]KAF8169890.1 hypothetical protein K438DRAFT_1983016 [Mycena galopus ATCC 62051]